MAVWSNAQEVIGDLADFLGHMQPDDRLGADLAELIGGAMHERCMRMVAPDQSPWKENAPATIRKKGHAQVGVGLTREMLKRQHFTDLWYVSGSTFELVYSGPTDKLGWFQGDNRYGIIRVAWGLDDSIQARVDRLLQTFLASKGQ